MALPDNPPPTVSLRRLLVTTDFSARAAQAIAYARAVVPAGGALRLVHVVHPRAIGLGEYESGLYSSEAHTAHLAELECRLRALLPSDPDAAGITADIAVVEDHEPAAGIAAEAERFDADAIVIASHGATGLERWVLGSVAQAVLATSRRPVLVIRTPAQP